ncbi:MAG TPA: BamA/TamA family outer membrane protein [Kofleriaceae bacterium]|jgi:hypothetical protein|nr:BamA/TamA family outer membrane protein [Kofleriaceae bacterium]
MPTSRSPSARARRSVAAALLAIAPAAAADPEPEPAQPPRVAGVVAPRPPGEPAQTPVQTPVLTPTPGRDLTAADVAADPVPGFESGRADAPEGDSTWRQIGRGALYVPRLAIDALLSPFRGAIWVEDHYHVTDWYDRIFYNDDHTIGLYPTAAIDTTLGVTVGARFVDTNLFGDHEQLGLQATVGSWFRQIYSASLSSGRRLGERFSLALDTAYERRPHDSFYGIGNGDLHGDVPMLAAPVDPRIDSTAVSTQYRQDRARLTLQADLRTWRQLHVRAATAISEVDFGSPDSGTPITTVYDPRGLTGFGGVQYGYGEFELRWDSRRNATDWEPKSVHSEGTLASVFAGRTHRLDGGPDYSRYGTDVVQFVRLADGPRTLIFHVHGEGVTGNLDQVPFTELPALGGPTYLRGYALDQFRDRVAAFGSLAYEWDLSQWVSARLFTDVGRVYSSLDDLTLHGLRVGYGVAIEGHSIDNFVVETSLGSSIDGGLFLNLSFNPVYDIQERVRRR